MYENAANAYATESPIERKVARSVSRRGSLRSGVCLAVGIALAGCSESTSPSQALTEPRLLFASSRDGNDEIYSMNADGTATVRLTNNSTRDNRPFWSPNGKEIAFTSERDGNREIYIMNADGSGARNLI